MRMRWTATRASSRLRSTTSSTRRACSPTKTPRSIVTPNSDTPYSFLWLDLRAEPMVLSVPAVDESRSYAVQLEDANTFNFGYIGSRSTGSEAGDYMVAGPDWKDETPA